MTYPASPNDARTNRVRPDSAQFWAGAVATAVVAALIALVGILICRWTLGIPILAPAGDGAWGNAHTGEYVLLAALTAIAAAGVLYLLVLGAPQALAGPEPGAPRPIRDAIGVLRFRYDMLRELDDDHSGG